MGGNSREADFLNLSVSGVEAGRVLSGPVDGVGIGLRYSSRLGCGIALVGDLEGK